MMSETPDASPEALESIGWGAVPVDDRARVARIAAELELGFHTLRDVEPAVAFFGSARSLESVRVPGSARGLSCGRAHGIQRPDGRRRARVYEGRLELAQMDARSLAFPDQSFDTVVAVCTFCSVPDPVRGLRELRRVLKLDGRLLLFEHVRSRLTALAIMQDLLTPLTRRFGPDMNRDTVANTERAGFRVVREDNVYLDMAKSVEAVPT